MNGIKGAGCVDNDGKPITEKRKGHCTTASADTTGRNSGAQHEHDQPLSRKKRHFKAWARYCYQKVVVELILRQKPLPPSKQGRRIPLDLRSATDPPLIDERRGHAFISNAIRTSRYNVFNFFPKQLIFQFTRLGNFYFLCVGIPQTIPGISTTGNFTTILPLLFFVLLTIVKEGYDDYKRHRLDKVENAQLVSVLRRAGGSGSSAGWWNRLWSRRSRATEAYELCDTEVAHGFQWKQAAWKDLGVGDVIKLCRDEDIPADLILLHADGENGLAYVETMALDGETNLKSKQVLSVFQDCRTMQGLVACQAAFVVEDPNADLYGFDGRVTVDGKTLPLTLNEIVYRGSTLRNTPCAIGIVVNSGEECKIRMNANQHPRAKRPALESVWNRIVLSLVLYVIILTMGCSIGYYLWRKSAEVDAWYIVGDSVPAEDIIIGYAIMFNNVIPLALYVSLEIVKIGQMLNLNGDLGMYDKARETPFRCNTSTILEDLGSIGYLLTDKTGTLTENVMKLRRMTVAGTSWLHDADLREENGELKGGKIGSNSSLVGKASAWTHSVEVDPGISRSTMEVDVPETKLQRPPSGRGSSSHYRSSDRAGRTQPDVTTEDLVEFIRSRPNSVFARKAMQCILAIALCHTCLPEVRDGQLQFQASSPDELALVRAASELGFSVVQRSAQQITLRQSHADGSESNKVYEILDVIEFSSKRKRMSIVLRCPEGGRIWLITKGADSMILPRLRMAHVALQKAEEVRQSAEMDRAIQRKSLQQEPRNSFGGRPSLTIRRSMGGPRPSIGGSGLRPPFQGRSKSFEINNVYGMDERSRPSLSRGASLDIAPTLTARARSTAGRRGNKFDFLDDPGISEEGTVFTRSFQLLDDFASEGLRTLLYAHKFIPEADYQRWKKDFHEAETSLVDRQARIEEAGELIEQELELLGASAIEDKLQKGVPQTIDKLRRANIKIWMLTGDKRETAINIAHSARICVPESQMYILDAATGDLESQMVEVIEDMQISGGGPASGARNHVVLVIDGHTLAEVESPKGDSTNPRLKDLLFCLIPHVDSVICCRASPAQKAFIVRATRTATASRPVTSPCLTLAIGDGANDLAMIAEAHVGIGISGREGLQAARVADFAISQFSYLQRLLLVHGRWNYVRTATFVLWTFWKEIFFYLPQMVFTRYTGYTGTSLYESWSLTVLNVLFTSLCVIVPGVWEQDLEAETLLAVPELYVYGQRGEALNLRRYFGWMLGGVVDGMLVFFGCWAGYGLFGQLGGLRDDGLFAFGDLIFSSCIVWTNWKLLIIETHYKSVIILSAFGITFAGWWVWQCFLSGIYAAKPSPYAVRGGFFHTFGRDPGWWLTQIGVMVLLFILQMGLKMAKRAMVILGLWRWGQDWWKRLRRSRKKPADWVEGNLEDLDLGLWQQMEKDPGVRERLRGILEAEEEDVLMS
ncbi:unnamed protein product [Discula destructiva]